MLSYYKWFWQFWRTHKAGMSFTIMLTIISIGLKTWFPIMLKNIIDAMTGHQSDNSVYTLIFAYLCFGVLHELVNRGLPLARSFMNVTFAAMIRNRYYRVFTERHAAFFQKYRTGDLLARLTDDVDAQWDRLAWYSCSGVLRPLEALLMLGMSLGVMFSYSWELTLWSFTPVPFLLYILAKSGDKMVQYTNAKQESVSECYDTLESCFSGIRIVKSTLSEEDQMRKYEEVLERRVAREKDFLRVNQLVMFCSMLVNHTGSIIVIFVGSYFTIRHRLTLGTFLLFIIYLERLIEPIWTMSWFYVSSKQIFRYVDRLKETEENIYDERLLPSLPEQNRENGHHFAGTLRVEEEFRSLEFRNVFFSYLPESRKDVLQDISFRINRGETLAIVGAVGAGKTTLLELIVNTLQPTRGTILFNESNLSSFPTNDIARTIGYIRQESLLFSETIFNNLSLGNEFNEVEMQRALKTAMLEKEIQRFPQGIHTMLGQRGISLSGGQKQRLSIARTLLRKPQLLLMDDCTAAMDAQTESDFWQAFKRELPHTACIIVTHRMATAKQADRIIVVNEGRISEEGNHQSLLTKDSLYRKFMVKQQIAETLAG